MRTRRQFTAFLANKPGRLATLCSALARAKVNIVALTVMDSREHSVLRFVTDHEETTKEVLSNLSIPYQETEVIEVELTNRPGALAKVCEKLSAEHINIDYAYCSAGARNGKTLAVFKVSNPQRALKVLASNGNEPAKERRRPGRRPAYAR